MTATTVPRKVLLAVGLVAVLSLGLLIGYAWADGRDGHHLHMRGMPDRMTSMPAGPMHGHD